MMYLAVTNMMKRPMEYYIYVLTILCGWNLLFCDANVTVSLINSANGVDSLECRCVVDGVVQCRINPYANLINWVIDGTPYATCSPGCSENPSFTRTYSPTYDVVNGIFNLTVDSVTFNDNSTTFECDDGSLSNSITIEVVPAYSENKTSINNGTDGGKQVEFTTACVQPGVEFDWFTVKTDNSERKTYKNGQTETINTTVCSLDSDCGGVGTGKVSSVISIPTVPKGEERYIEVVVKYKNPDLERTFRFNEKFQFEDCLLHCGGIIPLIYGSILISLLIVFCVGYYCSTWFQNYIEESDLECRCFVPIYGIIYTACLLYDNQREHYSRISCLVFFVCCSLDIGILIVMILTCTDIIEARCYIYGVYAVIGLVLSKMYIVCLAECLQKELPCKSCEIKLKGRKQCLYCKEFLCTDCKQSHLQTHEAIRTNHKHGQALNKCPCDSCMIEEKGRKKCIYCNEFLCKECTQKHLQKHKAETPGHVNGTINNENEAQLPCDLCKQRHKNTEGKQRCSKCHDFLCDTCTREHRKKHNAIISNYKNGHAWKNNTFMIADRFTCSHTENNVESYCLICRQYLCKWCINNHDEHRILRHCHQGAGNAGYQIFCKFCQNISIKEEARHYSKCDGSFFCEDGRTEKRLGDIIAVNACKQCMVHPFDCRKMDGNYVCAECFLEQPTEDTIPHANICALHPSLNRIDVNKLKADVFCLVCNEYLCKNCFKQHFDLKRLWINKILTNKATNS